MNISYPVHPAPCHYISPGYVTIRGHKFYWNGKFSLFINIFGILNFSDHGQFEMHLFNVNNDNDNRRVGR